MIRSMLHTTVQWAVPLVALFVLGPIAGWLTGSLGSPDGGDGATALLNSSPVWGVVATVLSIGLALLAGVAGAVLIGAHSGLFSAGLVLAWAAWGTGNIDEIVRRTQSPSSLMLLGVEGALVGAAAIAVAWTILRTARRAHPNAAADDRVLPLVGRATGIALALAVVAGGLAAWIIARESLKGQTVAAAAVGGLVAAVAGRVGVQNAPAAVFFAAMAVLAAASPVAAAVVHSGGAELLRHVQDGTLMPLARPMPLDWIAGAFLGIPIGLRWAGSMLEHHAHPQTV